jgi:hypothetical protein
MTERLPNEPQRTKRRLKPLSYVRRLEPPIAATVIPVGQFDRNGLRNERSLFSNEGEQIHKFTGFL